MRSAAPFRGGPVHAWTCTPHRWDLADHKRNDSDMAGAVQSALECVDDQLKMQMTY